MFSTFSTGFSTIKRDQPYTHRNSGSRFLESFGQKCRHSAFYKKESRRIFFAFYKPFLSGDLFFSNLEWLAPKFSTLGRCRFSVWKRRGKLQFSTPEKAAARGERRKKLPQSRCARQIPLFVAARHLPPAGGSLPLGWGLWQYGKVSGVNCKVNRIGRLPPVGSSCHRR